MSTAPGRALPAIEERISALFAGETTAYAKRTDRMFGALMLLQWVAAITFAQLVSPLTWAGKVQSVHLHVYAAVVLGAAITSLPLALIVYRPGEPSTRYVIACAQMLWSALLIHVSGGRIETHFHIFGSLAFLAFYRDEKILVPATLVVALDHFVRGWYWPESVYGVQNPEWWRFVEHAGWVGFIDIFLVLNIRRGRRVLRTLCARQVALEQTSAALARATDELEERVEERTAELFEAKGEVERKVLELRATQSDLVDASRRAGMAEIASAVLHNVGNVLTSIIAGAHLARTGIQQSSVDRVVSIVELMEANRSDLGPFFRDPRGAAVLPYLRKLTLELEGRRKTVLEDLVELEAQCDHAVAIVRDQQIHATGETVVESCALDVVVRHAVQIARPYVQPVAALEHTVEGPMQVAVDRNRLVSVVVNLVRNAAEAIAEATPAAGKICVHSAVEGDVFRVIVKDNGAGIAPEHLPRIFSFGFTTKSSGHGFGLHDAANAARAMGGSLLVASEGPGKGATFTLELPVSPERRAFVAA